MYVSVSVMPFRGMKHVRDSAPCRSTLPGCNVHVSPSIMVPVSTPFVRVMVAGNEYVPVETVTVKITLIVLAGGFATDMPEALAVPPLVSDAARLAAIRARRPSE